MGASKGQDGDHDFAIKNLPFIYMHCMHDAFKKKGAGV